MPPLRVLQVSDLHAGTQEEPEVEGDLRTLVREEASTTIAPYIPLAMCASTGFVPQWYMKTPALSATNS